VDLLRVAEEGLVVNVIATASSPVAEATAAAALAFTRAIDEPGIRAVALSTPLDAVDTRAVVTALEELL